MEIEDKVILILMLFCVASAIYIVCWICGLFDKPTKQKNKRKPMATPYKN